MNKKKVVLSTIIVAVIILMGISTYAFFTADIEGNVENNNIVQTTGTLSIEYVEGQNIEADNIRPGWSGTKTFTIKNNGTLPVSYDIVFADLINTFINDEVKINGTCTSNQDTCEDIEQGVIDAEDFFIKQSINIEPNEEHSYEIEIEFIETNENQDYNNQAELSGKVSVYETGTYKINPLKVDIVDNMIPVSWDGSTLIKADKTNTNNNWYDYDNQKWANVVLVTDAVRETIKSAESGTTIVESNILAYYTYIPRYRYQLWNANNNIDCLNDNCNEQEIKVRFERKNEPKSTGSTNGDWLTHPAFTFGDSELNGIWVGKFTTSVDPTTTCYTTPSTANCNIKTHNPRVKPNVDMWTFIDVATMFTVTKSLETNSIYGLNSYNNTDSHMMKNMEWGAVAYLSHSKYGKYGNENYVGENKQLYINNYRNEEQARITETGCSGGWADASQNKLICPYPYPGQTLQALGVSTTGNIYGIYDMSGGTFEYVMGNMIEEDTSLGKFNANSQSGTWDTIPDIKYYDSYAYDTIYSTYERGYLGGATRETLKTFATTTGAWYSDGSTFSNGTTIWFYRGGSVINASSSGGFSFNCGTGNPNYPYGFRVVLAIE